jgi:hypothetical protein
VSFGQAEQVQQTEGSLRVGGTPKQPQISFLARADSEQESDLEDLDEGLTEEGLTDSGWVRGPQGQRVAR